MPAFMSLRLPSSSLVIILLVAATPFAGGTLLSSSQLQLCSRSNASAEVLPCTKKFVVAIALDGGQNNTEQVIYWQSATDASTSKTVTLPSRVTISFSKSRPLLVYPLTYVRNFNAKPYETTVFTSVLQGCHDGASDGSPTCGRAYDDTGARVPFSEGFCCTCSACQLLGICSSQDRGNTRCAVLGSAAAAACLNFGPLWYSGYSIGPAQTWYSIAVTITQKGRAAVTLTVGPDNLAAASSAYGVSVRLIGDFAAFEQPQNFESSMLFVPSVPASDPIVTAGVSEWLLLPTTMVTTDGTECNKVGISYEAFVTQGSRCDVPSGTCLSAQLTDLRTADAKRVAAGTTPLYLATAKGQFELVYGSTTATSSTPFLAFVQNNVQASEIVLTFVADNMSYAVNTATGAIIAVNVSSFSALSSDGKVTVTVLNTGSLTADFYVSILQCTSGTLAVASQTASIAALHLTTLEFALRSVTFVGSTLNSCNVTLMDSQYAVIDSRVITFNVSGVSVDNGAQGGNAPNVGGSGNPPSSPSSSSTDCTDCPFYNPVCFITRSCFWQIVVQILVVLAVIGLIVLVVRNRSAILGLCRESEEARAKRLRREEIEALREEMRMQRQLDRELDDARRQQRDDVEEEPDDESRYVSPSPRRRRVSRPSSPASHRASPRHVPYRGAPRDTASPFSHDPYEGQQRQRSYAYGSPRRYHTRDATWEDD